MQIWSNGPRDRLPCPSICSSHTSASPHHSHLSITFSLLYTPLLLQPRHPSSLLRICSSPRPLSFPTPKACLFPHLTSSADFSTLLLSAGSSLHPSLSPSLPRCAKWKLSQRPEVAIVTCHSNHSPSCVSPSRRRGLGASAALLCSSQSGVSVQQTLQCDGEVPGSNPLLPHKTSKRQHL